MKLRRAASAFVPFILVCSVTVVAEDPREPPQYRGFVPGQATFDDVRSKLGESPIRTRSPQDLRYPVNGKPSLSDRLFFRNSRLELVTAASTDAKFPDRRAIEKRLGPPEAEVLFQTQQYLDYTEHGLRFICRADGTTTGMICFRPRRRRIPEGYANVRIDLRRQVPEVASAKPAAITGLRAGAAEESIAPAEFDDLLAGGAGAALTLAEDLLARVVVFDNGDQRIVFAGLDVFGLGPWDIQKLRDSLAEKGFANVIVAMSHTHANVDTIGFYGYYPEDYAALILRRTEAAVLRAAASMQPVRELRSGSVEMPLDGGRVIDLVRNGRDPGVMDPTVSVLQAIGENGRPIANIVHLACHPEVIDLEETRGLSPDFVGTLCRDVSARLGGQTVFLNGALGGMLTPDARFRTQAAAEETGHRLAEYAIAAAKSGSASDSAAVFIETRTVEYPVTGGAVKTFLENAPGPVEMHEGRVRAEMSVVWIGDAQFITVPGELLPDIGFEITQRMSGRMRVIVGLANGELGYLIPGFDFRDGGYEEATGPGAAGGEITRAVGLDLAARRPEINSAENNQ